MTEKTDNREPILPPATDPKRAVNRVILESVAEFFPIVGPIGVQLAGISHPPQAERDRDAWQRAISMRSNEHDERLDRHEALLTPLTETLTGTTAQLIRAVAHACSDGLAETFIELDELRPRLPDADENAVIEAAQDLAARGLLTIRDIIGSWAIRPTQIFYEQFDSQVMDWGSAGTRQDAAFLASLILEHENGDAPSLHELTKWPLRRFNPALAHLQNTHTDWSWRDPYHFDYPTYGLAVGPREQAGLRRFIIAVELENR